MQAVSKGLEKVEQEFTALENDGAISASFQKALKNFLYTAEAEVRSLISLYSEVIHCLSISGRIQLGALLNKVWFYFPHLCV
ncbi:formin-like protein 3 [Camellia sinensis]|uniref:formin-like protein 3 n=1 Tax=Camellia sinensis TaxID=4442 RepID=UPI0010365916|nr:formin-like protein 3 [Camellia sinensis]